MFSGLPNNKKSIISNYNNYYSSYFNKLSFYKNNNYNSKKNSSIMNKKNLSLNIVNNKKKGKNSKELFHLKRSNNSAMNINNNISFHKTTKSFQNKTKSENNSLNKIETSSSNKEIKCYRNNFNKNLNSSFNNKSKDNTDFFKQRYNLINNKYKYGAKDNDLSNRLNISSIEGFNKINKKNDNHQKQHICEEQKNKKIQKSKIFNIFESRSKTPVLSSNVSNNNSKSKNKYNNKSNNNSKEKKILNNSKTFKNNILYYGANLNLSKIIHKNNCDLKNNMGRKLFQSNNIFAQFKPKKKSRTIILQEELKMKKNFLLSNFINSKPHNENINNENVNKQKNIKTNLNNNNNNSNEFKDENSNANYFIEIHPKIIQKDSSEKIFKIEPSDSNKEILPLTNNSTKMNIFLNNNGSNNNSKTNSNLISSSTFKQQFGSNNNIALNNNITTINNESNSQLHNLNIISTLSLNNNTNKNNNTNNIDSSNNKNPFLIINSPQQQASSQFNGKKIKCIHDISKTGLSGDEKKINQDRYFIFRNFVEGFDNIYMGVCDGHGYFGNEVSEYIKENLPMDLNRIIKTRKLDLNKDDLSEVIINTFIMENNSLLRNKQIDSDLSGSTCVSVIYTPQKLIIANLGDSRCVLGKNKNGNWEYENLSRDHKPNIKEEADRIKKSGGRIRPMIDEDGCFIGPLRVYMKDKDLPGLAMTRSFGDYFASIAGTISTPEVKEHILMPEDKFFILASDGLFEYISSEEVGNIVKKYYEKNDVVGCCEYLYKESYRKWIVEEEDTVDDITIILVFLED